MKRTSNFEDDPPRLLEVECRFTLGSFRHVRIVSSCGPSNEEIKVKIVEGNLASMFDYYSGMLDERGMLKKELTSDGVHPNDAGYEIMGPLASKAITQALSKR